MSTKELLLHEAEAMPEPLLQEVLDFMRFLRVTRVPADIRDKVGAGGKKRTLETLLEQITPENLHGEVDMGEPVGKEVW